MEKDNKKETALPHGERNLSQYKSMKEICGEVSNSSRNSQIPEEIISSIDASRREAEGDADRVHLDVDYPDPDYTFKVDGVPTMPRGDISAIKAKSKNGKTFLVSIFAAAVLGDTSLGCSPLADGADVMFFDTEQAKPNTANVLRRIHALLGWNIKEDHAGLQAFSLRAYEPEKRLRLISQRIKEEKPVVAFLDGVGDLLADFNDVAQSTELVTELLRLSTDSRCHICCVLHENKRSEDRGMKGHLGTMLLQKASDVYEVRKDGATFTVEETDCRNLPIRDFSFLIDNDGVPRLGGVPPVKHAPNLADKIRERMAFLFAEKPELPYTELRGAYREAAGCSLSSSEKHIGLALVSKILTKTNEGNYTLFSVPELLPSLPSPPLIGGEGSK